MKKLFEKMKSYSFWVSFSGALIIFINCLGRIFNFQIENEIVEDVIMSIAGLLVVLGFVTKETKNEEDTGENVDEENNENIDEEIDNSVDEKTDKNANEEIVENTDENINENTDDKPIENEDETKTDADLEGEIEEENLNIQDANNDEEDKNF